MVARGGGCRQIILFLVVVCGLAGCTRQPPVAAGLSCEPVYASTRDLSAEQYYAAMLTCVKENKYQDATLYYSLAGVSTWYDARKHPAEARKDRHRQLLSSTLLQMSPEEKNRLWSVLKAEMHSSVRLNALCKKVAVKAPPGAAQDNLWESAMFSYLHCPQYLDASAL